MKRNVGLRTRLTAMDFVLFVVLTLGALMILIPFWNVIAVSFSTQKEYADNPLMFFPSRPTLESYQNLIADGRIWTGYQNTFLLLALALPISMFLTTSMAYGVAHKPFPGKKLILSLVLFTMIFNGGIVPLYLVMKEFGLTGSIWSVVFANCFNVYHLILMMNYFRSLPESLMESAQLDGAGEWRILFKIVLPLSMPIIATITLFYGVNLWNQWYESMIFLRKGSQMPLQNILRSIIQETEVTTSALSSMEALDQPKFSTGMKMAAVFVTMIPIMCFFPFLQKHFAKGVMVGAIKT